MHRINIISLVLLTSYKNLILAALVVVGGVAKSHADIVCTGTTSLGKKGTVNISNSAVTVSGGSLTSPRVFANPNRVNGLITAPSLAITMKNNFGCMRDAVIITEFQEPFGAGYMEVMLVDTCSGGTTSDEICHPTK